MLFSYNKFNKIPVRKACIGGTMGGDIEFLRSIEVIANRLKQQTFDDLQYELSGLNTGRIARHLSEDKRGLKAGASNDKQMSLSSLQLLLQDDDYKAAYNETFENLKDTESLLNEAITQSSQDVHDAKSALEDAQKQNASAEELERLRKALKEAEEKHRKLADRDAELQVIRDRMQDQDNPPSQEEIDNINAQLGEIRLEMGQMPQLENEIAIDETQQADDLDLSGLDPLSGPHFN